MLYFAIYIRCMSATDHRTGQEAANVSQNVEFFNKNKRYARLISSLDTYRQVRLVINHEIAGTRRLLDVGNGGVFDYDTDLAERIVGVDLFLDGSSSSLDGRITLRHGDALALQETDASYDAVLESFMLHHLAGIDVDSTLTNVRRALEEAHRVLSPGGRLIVIESCISVKAFAIERRLFGGLRRLAGTPLMNHPATLQFPPETIAEVIGDRFGNVTAVPIPVGRWLLQFGWPWPAALTPARNYLFTATRV
jgi:SAM-dependent methyltransferase